VSNKAKEGRELEIVLREIEERNARTFAEAETHLELKPGTLADNHTESDFVALVKISATIEPLLNEAIETECKQLRKFKIESDSVVALTAFVQRERNRQKKAQLAFEMGIISKERCDFIKAVFDIRDHYAHHVKNLHLSVSEVAKKLQATNGQIFMHVAGLDMDHKGSKLFAALFIRAFIFHRFALFLSAALSVIKPPPLPPGLGLLGSLGWTSGENTPIAPIALAASAAPLEKLVSAAPALDGKK
jgi:hypothetical protein